MTRTHQLSPPRCAKLKKRSLYRLLPYRASEDEVSAVFEMPLAQALHLGRYHPLDIYRRGDSHRVWLSWYEQYFVWGMTAGIIRELALQIGVKP